MEVELKQKNVMKLDATPDPRVLEVLSSFPLGVPHCFAEIIDNSIDNFKKNKIKDGRIEIDIQHGLLRFIDNGSGMDIGSLEKSVKAGSSNKSKYSDLGLFGVGFNIATSKLGDITTIFTKQESSEHWYSASLDIKKLIQNGSFLYECDEVKLKNISFSSGTIIEIKLKKEISNELSRKANQKEIREKLGEIYSYMIRTGVPGLTGEVACANSSASILFQGVLIKPKLPCIWSENRTTSNGDKAVIKIDDTLPNQKFCEACGNWEIPQAEECSQCKSTNIELVERKIWGWLGVQRYLDTDHFGVTFLRNGRAIDLLNKEVFRWHDPNSNSTDNEYPIEMPANRGRLVGEIHCSHCRVSPSKDRFDPEDAAFKSVINHVRGLNPLKPNTLRGSVNDSPLNKLFKVFRRNDPGLSCLVPGDGQKANHDQSANWAKKFYEGEIDWQSDDNWYVAAENHDKLKASGKGGRSIGGQGGVPAPMPLANDGNKPSAGSGQLVSTVTSPQRKTLKQKENDWQAVGTQRLDLTFTFNLKQKSWDVTAYETCIEIRDDNEIEHSAFVNPGAGRSLTAYVNTRSELVAKFGRSTTDLLLLEVASYVKAEIASPSMSVTDVYSKLLANLPDEEFSQAALLKKIDAFRDELRKKSKHIFTQNAAEFLSFISSKNLEIIKTEQSSLSPELRWEIISKNGEYIDHINFAGYADILKKKPQIFFDGNLFKANWSSQPTAQERVLRPVLDALDELERLFSVSAWNDYEKSTIATALKHLHSQLV